MAFFFTGCATKMSLVDYDQTNPVKIEEATKGLDLVNLLPNPDEIKGTIAVKSIEMDIEEHLDDYTDE